MKRSRKGFGVQWSDLSKLADIVLEFVPGRLRRTPVVQITPLMENGTTIGPVAPLTTTLVREEFFEHLVIDKLLREVIVHHFYLGIYNSRWNTKSITLVGLRPIVGQVHLPLGIVMHDHLVTSTLLSCKQGVMVLLPDVGHSRLTFEQFVSRHGLDW